MLEKTVKVSNISCGHCVDTIEREVGRMQSVDSVLADQASKEVTLHWTDDGPRWEAIASHLADVAYPVEEPAPAAGARG